METKTDQELRMEKDERERRNKRLGFWNPSAGTRQKQYYNWLRKQADQRQKTLELDGVSHSRQYKNRLRMERAWYIEESKRVADLIEDGR
jgi:hypothetical protein